MSFELVGNPDDAYGPLDEARKKARWIEHGADHAWLWYGGNYLEAYLIGWGRVFVGRFVFTSVESPTKARAEIAIRRFECLMQACAEANSIDRYQVTPSQVVLYGIRTMNMDRVINKLLERLGKVTSSTKRQLIRNKINQLRGYAYRAPWTHPQIFVDGQKISDKKA